MPAKNDFFALTDSNFVRFEGEQVCFYKTGGNDPRGRRLSEVQISIEEALALANWLCLAAVEFEGELPDDTAEAEAVEEVAVVEGVSDDATLTDDGNVPEEFQIVHRGSGWYDVLDANDDPINEAKIKGKDAAVAFLDDYLLGLEGSSSNE